MLGEEYKKIQSDYAAVQSVPTVNELLTNDVDLIIVNTPNITHYELTKKALLANKHVVVEKPFTVTVEQANELIELAHQQQKILSVYHNRRFDSDYLTIQKVLQEKLLGTIVEAEFHFDRYVPTLSAKLHKEAGDKGTGALYDLGSHLIDQALQLFGMPTAVFADIQILREHSLVDDYFEVLLYYNQLRVRIKGTYFAKEPIVGYTIHGTEGSFLKPKTNNQEEALQKGILPTDERMGVENKEEWGWLHTNTITKQQIPSLKGNYMRYYENIYQAITNNQPLAVTAEQAKQVIQIIEAAFESNKWQKVVTL